VRAGGVVLATRVIGDAVWLVALHSSWSSLAVVAVVEAATIVAYLNLLGRAVDFAIAPLRGRLVALALVAPTLFLVDGAALPTDVVIQAAAATPEAAVGESAGDESGPEDPWFSAARARLNRMPDDGPVIFVAASGGGSRAAIFASLVFDTMSREPGELRVLTPSGGATAPSWKRPLSDYVFAVSSVSGGSVASAQYVATRSSAPWEEGDHPATRLLWPSVLHSVDDRLQEQVEAGKLARVVLGERHVLEPMLVNFNAIAVRGFLDPLTTRGRALSDFWAENFGWSERLGAAEAGEAPLLLVNATLIASGRPLVIGFPSVPQDLLADGSRDGVLQLAPASADRITRVSLERLDGGAELRVEDAVRLSASFPFGMDSARIEGLDRAIPSALRPSGSDVVYISDGGVVDNTGTGTIRELLTGVLGAADRGVPGAREVAEILRRRGVLVVEIDSGAKPVTAAGVLGRVFGPVKQSTTVLSQASYTVEREAVFLRRSVLERNGIDLYWATFSYCPRSDREEVMTAWGLGPGDQINLLEQYFGKTLTGACSRREVPIALPPGPPPMSPLGAVGAAFQASDPSPGEAVEILAGNPGPLDDARRRLLRAGVDHAVLAGEGGLALALAEQLESDPVVNETITMTMMAPGLRLASAGRVSTIDHDQARSGWFAAARFRARGGGPRELEWSVLWADSSVGLDGYVGHELSLARPVLIHAGTPEDPFSPGPVVALADRLARPRIVALREEVLGEWTTVYVHASWGDAISQVTPCTDLAYIIRTCPGEEGRADELERRLVAAGNVRAACLQRGDPLAAPEDRQAGDEIGALPALRGDAAAMESWARGYLGTPFRIRELTSTAGTGLEVRLCTPLKRAR
jgi:hypothetical protein